MNRNNLHDYQNRAVDFIINRKRCALFLDMGFISHSLGARVLRTETACCAALAILLGRLGLL